MKMKKHFKIAMLALAFCAMSAMASTLISKTAMTAEAATVGWNQDSTGWWYENPDGSYPINKWEMIDDTWYRFDTSGYMQTGWFLDGVNWYYFKSDGAMAEDWQQIDGKWYFFFYGDGEMAYSYWMDDGYIGADGAWIPADMSSCWQLDSTGWWFRNPDGTYLRNEFLWFNDSFYRFDDNGYMVVNQWCYDVYNEDGYEWSGWYYYKDDGTEAYYEWVGNYFIGYGGYLLTNAWIGEYYVDETGLYSGISCQHDWQDNTSEPDYYYYYHPYPESDWEIPVGKFGATCKECGVIRW